MTSPDPTSHSLRRLAPCILIFVAAIGATSGLCDGGGGKEIATATGKWYFWRFDGTSNRRWVVETEIDPGSLPTHGLHHGTMVMYEVTQFPDAEPTPEQRQAAESLVARSFEAARRHHWFNFSQALEDGYTVWGDDPEHFRNEDYLLDDHILDPDRPEFLIYNDTKEDGRKLSGFMYQVRPGGERGLQVGGPLTIWHYHVWTRPQCLLRDVMLVGTADANGTCARGEPSYKSPEMLHVWFVDRPDGPFSTKMGLTPDERTRLGERDY